MNDIFNKIINNIKGLTSSNSLKRKSDEQQEHSQFTKYRKVSNDFPKIISKPFEDDIHFLQPEQQLRYNSSVPLMSERKSLIGKSYRLNAQKSQTQNSQTQHQQTNFADTEYSDDDDDISLIPSKGPIGTNNALLKKRFSAGSVKQNNIENIFPALRKNPRFADFQNFNTMGNILSGNGDCGGNLRNRKPLPQLIEMPQHRSNLATTNFQQHQQQIPNLDSIRKISINDKLHSAPDVRSRYSLFNKKKAKNLSQSSYLISPPQKILSQIYNEKEKECYADLLQALVPSLYNKNKSLRNSATELKGNDWGSHFKIIGRKSIHPGPYRTNNQLSGLNSLVDKNDLLSNKGRTRHQSIPTLSNKLTNGDVIYLDDDDDENNENDIINLDDDDLKILKMHEKYYGSSQYNEKNEIQSKKNELPYVEPVNSLKEKNSLTPYCAPDWLQTFHQKINQKKLEKDQKFVDAEKEVSKAEKERFENEQILGEKMKNFHIGNEIIILDEEEEEEEEIEFPQLNENVIKKSVSGGSQDQVLVTKFNMSITRRHIHTLIGDAWLNDEVINFYMNLLIERGDEKCKEGYPKVYAMNTFFIPKLLGGGHSTVRRWTRKVDIFSYDIIPVPVHVGGVHWCMAIINLKEKSIKYYDSMGTPNPRVLDALEHYLREESMDKKKQTFNTSDFYKESVADCPRQMNGSDCGVFSCMFAEYISRGKSITFSQQHMPYFRNKMIFEIVQGKLLL